MGKRIVICFDGTWNTPDRNGAVGGDTSTNVCKLYEAVLPQDEHGTVQRKWYDEGVGTRWYNRIRGGALGLGLSRNIQEGYRHLVEQYEEGDEVFVFGFSRGAYTARSLVGLVRNAGLLHPEHVDRVPEGYRLYRTRGQGADSSDAVFFRQRFSRMIAIRCLGVWDTVGALGIPLRTFGWLNRGFYEFHDTELSSIVENAFHAVAIDEHRENYQPALWDPKHKPNQRIEQVWFAGAHSNVGGGYPERELSDITLAWMASRAASCGLALDPARIPQVCERHCVAPVRDSYRSFLRGFYGAINRRHYRPMGITMYGEEAVDESVGQRWIAAGYRPPNPIGPYIRNAPWQEEPAGMAPPLPTPR